MKKRLMSTLLMGAFFLASTSMFVSCKDYDDDINANTQRIQNVESALLAQKTALDNAIAQAKADYTAADNDLKNALKDAQAAVDAAQDASLAKAIQDANSTHATKQEVKDLTADKATVDALNSAIATLKAELNTAITNGDNANSTALTNAIAEVNSKLTALNGDIAAATNAQTQIRETLTSAIAAVDKKADQSAVDALTTALEGVKQSLQTKEAVQAAIDIAKGEIATNIQAVQAAADKAQSDATSAKADLATLAEKVSTAAAAQAAAETKIKALEDAKATMEELDKTLQKGITDNATDIKLITNQISKLDAQIGAVSANLSTLIGADANTIQNGLQTIANIDLQIAALNKFCGNLDALNVAGIRDSMRLSFKALEAAKQEAAQNLADAEVRAALNAAGYVAILNTELTARIDSLRDKYATAEELATAEQAAKDYAKGYVDNLDVPALQETVDALTKDLGDKSIADIIDNLDWVNNTLTWAEDGSIINLEQELKNLNGDIAEITTWQGDIDTFVENVKNNVAGYQTAENVQDLIDAALKGADGKDKYVALAEINTLLSNVAMAETYKAAGVALTSDLAAYAKTTDLDSYLKIADIDLTKVGASIGEARAKELANEAITEANLATKQELANAIKDYDAELASSLDQLFNAVKPVAEDKAAAEEANKTAAEVIKEIAEAYASEGGISPAVVEKINVLRISMDSKLTSLVFYPEYYYGGIESIEITALKIEQIYNQKAKIGTANETFTAKKQESREFDLFPNGYAKYHVNPVNADLSGYKLAFIDHTAYTRSADAPYLKPVEEDASKNYRDANDVLWVEFENNAEVYNAINNISSIPSMGHYTLGGERGTTEVHFVYGQGKDNGKGVVTALTATNEDAEGESAYVASDYALIVPVTINKLVLANAKENGDNSEVYETSTDIETGYLGDTKEPYYCNAAMKFHLHQKAIERVKDETQAVNTLKYDQQFNLKDLVETHFVNSAMGENADEKMDDELFERLNLDYRFYPIDYTTDDITGKETTNKTSETKFMTLTEKDPVDGSKFNGIGYFNQVQTNAATNGEKIKGDNPFGGDYLLANKACVGRRPVVRVELYNKETNIIYAIGYLKIEIVEEEAVNAETFDMVANSNKLFATCEVEVNEDEDFDGIMWDSKLVSTDYMELRWDQIQTELNKLVGGSGLKPADWNLYTVEDGQYFKNAEGEFELITESYDPEEYPYYAFGWLNKGEDLKSQGNHTDVLRWYFADCDYESLFFDLQSRYSETNKVIDKTTGKVLTSITRYFKLSSANKANPDLYIGLTIPSGYIYYPAGTIGKVQGGFWKQAAKNTAGDNDIILNTDIIVASGGNEAATSTDVANGKFMKNLVEKFFGEKILIDFNYGDLAGDDLAEAKDRFENYFKDYYADAPFYFRAPNANDDNEKKVYEGGKWVVYGLSGNKYTLAVTDLKDYDYSIVTTTTGGSSTSETKKGYYNYGSSVSVIQVNDKSLGRGEENLENLKLVAADLGLVKPNVTPQLKGESDLDYQKRTKEAYDAAVVAAVTTLSGALQRIQLGDSYTVGIRIMTLDTDPESATFTKIELLTQLLKSKGEDDNYAPDAFSTDAAQNAIVKGITQDMLNYKKHNSEGDVERPYNKQLTAFVGIYAMDEAIYAQPDCDNFGHSEISSDKPYEAKPCYILPGYNQGSSNCSYCKAEKLENILVATYKDCFRPFVVNKTFAVRFYDPVSIESGDGAALTDADLGKNTWTINYSSLVKFTDWANYTPSKSFKNFIKYYGIQITLPEEFDNPAASQATALAKANGAKEPNKAPTDPKTVKTDDNYGYTSFSTKTKDAEIYDDAKAYLAGYTVPATAPEKPEESAAPVAPATGDPDAAANKDTYAQVDAPKYVVMTPSYNTAHTLTTAPVTTGNIKTGDVMKNGTDYTPTLGTAPYATTRISSDTYTPAAKPTVDATKNTLPTWTKDAEDAATPNVATWLDGDGNKQTAKFNDYAKEVYDGQVNGTTIDDYETKITGTGAASTAAKAYFAKMKAYQAALEEYNVDALVYSYYQKDAAAWTAFFVGDPLEATQDQIDAYFAGKSTYDPTITYYVDATDPNKLTSDPTKAKIDGTTSIAAQNEAKQKAYNEAKAQWDAYQLELAAFTASATGPYADYQKYLAATKYVAAYEVSYTPNNDLTTPALAAGTASEKNYPAAKAAYDADNAIWTAAFNEAMDALEGEQDLAWKRLVYTDLDIVGTASARPALKDAAAIEKLHTLAEVAPKNFVFQITKHEDTDATSDVGTGNNGTQNFKGSLTAYYQNTNANTNLPFHLYVPLYVTYNYLNEAPGAPKVVYAVLTVNSTTGNVTTGARRK